MKLTHQWAFVACVVTAAVLTSKPARAQTCKALEVSPAMAIDTVINEPASFEWQGEWQQDDGICFPSKQSGAQLRAYLVVPKNIDTLRGPLPVVVISPGSSGIAFARYYLWSARDLAGHGYIALVVDPQGNGRSEIVGDPTRCGASGCPGVPAQNAFNYVDALQSATDFVFTRGHPWLQKADLTKIGLAGHSLSSRAANYLQGVDDRIDAVVAWDNLASTLEGDVGTPSGGGSCGQLIGGQIPGASIPVTPRVPTMGQASDAIGTCNPTNSDPDIKKAGYFHWRQAGVPSMQVVFLGSAHGDWAQSRNSVELQLQSFEYYTRNWFDLYLKGDQSAAARLLATEVLGQKLEQVMSANFRSAAFVPAAKADCDDLLSVVCKFKVPAGGGGTLPLGLGVGTGGSGALNLWLLIVFSSISLLRRKTA